MTDLGESTQMSSARISPLPGRSVRFICAARRRAALFVVASLSAGSLAVATTIGLPISAAGDVITNSADNLRTGWYANQPNLSPAAVAAGDFGQLGYMDVVGQVYAQPVISDNVLLAATELNNIYGFNATTRAKLWERNLGTPFNALSTLQCGDIKPLVGITSTPAVDPATNTAYVMSKVSSPSVAWYLHAIDLATGADRSGWPVLIQGTADNDPAVQFNATKELQRPGLLLMNGVVYAGFSGHCDSKPFYGWVIGVSAATGSITARWSDETSPNSNLADGPGGGIWMSGSGLVSDASGDILLSTGNGTPPPTGPAVAGQSALGQTLSRLRVQPNGTLKVVDYFAPYDAATLNESDSDVGSGGPVALPPQYFGTSKYPRLTVLIGKQSYIWLSDATDLGGVGQGALGGDKVIQRIGKLAGGVRGKPAVWPGDGGYIYIATSQSGGGQGRLLAFKYGLDGNGNPQFTQTGKSSNNYGFGSGSPVVTSDGTTSGSALVWATRFSQTYDSNNAGVGAVLDVYRAIPDSSIPLNNGNMVPLKSFPLGQGTKFGVPAVDNEHVFIGTSDGRILEFGSPVTAPLTGPSVSFPLTTQGSTSTKTATVTAQQAVTVRGVSINNAQYSVGSPTPAVPVTLTAGQTLSVPIAFSPTSNGQVLATLNLDTDAGVVPISVSGEGQTTAPKLVQGSCCVSFGGVVAGGPTATDTVTFSNAGSQDLVINGYDLPDAPFSVSGLPATGTHLASGQSVIITFSFATPESGVFADDFLIHTNDPTANYEDGIDGSPNAGGVALSGSAGTQGVMRIVPKDLNFGDVPMGTTAAQAFSITNTGGTDLNINISKDPAGLNGFSAASSLSEGSVIAAGETVTELVNFTPATTGQLSATWAISGDDGGGRQEVTLIGKGVPAVPANPTLSIADLDVSRPATGTTTANVAVRLSAPSSSPVTVKYTTKDGTAVAASDYTAASGTLTFAPGTTSQAIPLTITGATPAPAAETLTVNLSTATAATIADGSGKVYLNTTYLPVSIAVGDTTATAATSGTTTLNFPVTVAPAPYPGQPVTVKVATTDGTALAASGDYSPVNSSLTFTSDTPTQTVSVQLLHNPAVGASKTVQLTLNTASTGSNIGDTSGLGTVFTSAQPLPALSVSDTAIVRPATGTAGATFTVRLSRPSTTTVPVSYTAVAGTGFTTGDFVPTSGSLTFAPGVTSQTVTVPVNGSATSSGTGNVNLNLSGQSQATIADTGGKAYVVSPVVHSFISVQPATGWRGPSNDTTVNVPITLDAPARTATTIPVSTSDGTAVAGVDYAATATSVTFAPGDSQTFLPVTIKAAQAVTATKAFSVTLGAASGVTQVSSGTATVTVVSHTADATVAPGQSAPLFTTSSVPSTAQVGQPYNTTVSASGVPEPAYSITGGKLPDGLALDARTGQLSGTPTAGGHFSFVITASNTIGTPASSGDLVIDVVAPNAPAQFTAASPPGSTKVGTAYSYTFAANGNPAPTFAVATGQLPPGIGLDTTTGVLSGSATASGSYGFTVSATNGVGSPATSGQISIAVSSADVSPAFTNASPPAGAAGASYSYAFSASGSPAPTFTIGAGTLPAGLSLSTAGLLSGTPTGAGTFNFTVQASNNVGTPSNAAVTVTITSPAGAPVVTAATPPGGATVGKTYTYTFKATGTPTPMFSIFSGTLPPGVSLSTAGLLSGTPTADGTFSFTVRATNNVGSDTTGQLTVIVAKAPAKPKFTASKPPTTTTTGADYSYTFLASGWPTPSYGVVTGALPPGLTLNPSTGVLAGSATAAGTSSFTISATNSAGTVNTSKITVTVNVPPVAPAFTSGPPPATATVGAPFSFTFTASGVPAPTFKLATGALPAGIKLSSGGVLSGSPTKVATYSFSAKATNTAGTATTVVFTMTTSK